MSDDNDDVLSLNSENDDSFVDEDHVQTRSNLAEGQKKPRVVKGGSTKRKLSEGQSGPIGKPKVKRAIKNTRKTTTVDYNVDTLKAQLGIESILHSISSLTSIVQNQVVNRNSDSLSPNFAAESTERNVVNNYNADIIQQGRTLPPSTSTRPNDDYLPRPRPLISLGDSYEETHPEWDPFDVDSFCADNLSVTVNNNPGVDPLQAFNNAFDIPPNNGEVNNNEPALVVDEVQWDIPQLNTEEKTAPKIIDGLAKAVNAAVSIKSNKESMQDIAKRQLRPENCTYLCAPRVNKEIWEAVGKQAHSNDLNLQEIQKSMALGMVPIVKLANQLSTVKEALDPVATRGMLTDSISLLGHSFYNLSQKRRYELKGHIAPRYKKICASDVPISNNLFGDNCHTRIKELGDTAKYPIGFAKSGSGRGRQLNWRGPVVDRDRSQQGHSQQTYTPRGRGRAGNRMLSRSNFQQRTGQKRGFNSYQNYNYQ